MRVQQVGKVNFGHELIVDIGASDREHASCKISLLTDAGKELDSFQGKVSLKPFEKDTDLADALTARLAEFELKNKAKIDALKGKDRELRVVTGFAPGGTIGNKAGVITNLVKTNGQSLQNVDYNTIPAGLRTALADSGIVISKDLKFMLTNDMHGTGPALAAQLGKKKTLPNVLKSGAYYSLATDPKSIVPADGEGVIRKGYHAGFYMIGGGAGCGEVDVLERQVIAKTVERAHRRVKGTGKNIQTYESTGASSTSLIRNFAKALGLDEAKTKALVATGNARVATQHTITTSNEEEIAALLKTELYMTTKFDGTKAYLTLKDVSEQAHLKASRTALRKFINTMAQMCMDRVIDGVHHVILTGPLTAGVGKDLKHNPKLFGGKSLIALIGERTKAILNKQAQDMADKYNTSIIELPLANNTVGGHLAGKGRFVSEDRGNWLVFPRSVFQRAARAVKKAANAV